MDSKLCVVKNQLRMEGPAVISINISVCGTIGCRNSMLISRGITETVTCGQNALPFVSNQNLCAGPICTVLEELSAVCIYFLL